MSEFVLCLQDSGILFDARQPIDLRARLDRVWRRAQFERVEMGVYQYCARLLDILTTGRLPAAALSALAHLPTFDQRRWYAYMDPVHLLPDRDTLLMLPSQQLDISADEAQRLIKTITEFNQDDAWRIDSLTPSHWLLSLAQAPDVQFSDLELAQRGEIFKLMPSGAHAAQWRKTLNELQMLLYSHPVNRQREQSGRTLINSVWWWGEGQLSQMTARPTHKKIQVISANEVIVGLAKYRQATSQFIVEDIFSYLQHKQGNDLYLMTINVPAGDDFSDGEKSMRFIRDNYLTPLYNAINDSLLIKASVYFDCGWEMRLDRHLMRKVWRSF